MRFSGCLLLIFLILGQGADGIDFEILSCEVIGVVFRVGGEEALADDVETVHGLVGVGIGQHNVRLSLADLILDEM